MNLFWNGSDFMPTEPFPPQHADDNQMRWREKKTWDETNWKYLTTKNRLEHTLETNEVKREMDYTIKQSTWVDVVF